MRLVAVLLLASIIAILSHSQCFAQDGATNYFQIAQAYADGMIEHGRDCYGDQHSPAFVATLDLRTMKMPQETSDTTRRLYSSYFRAEDYSTSVNPMYHIDLYQLLDALTVLTDDPKYRQAGRDSIEWFFKNTQSPTTGLMAWGEHLAWDLIEDKITVGNVRDGKLEVSDTHEFYGPGCIGESLARLPPTPHGALPSGSGSTRSTITKRVTTHAMPATRSTAHDAATSSPVRLASIWIRGRLLIRRPRIPICWLPSTSFVGVVGAPTESQDWPATVRGPIAGCRVRTAQPGICRDGWEAATKLPEPQAGRLKTLIRSVDDAILKLETDLTPEGKGFQR